MPILATVEDSTDVSIGDSENRSRSFNSSAVLEQYSRCAGVTSVLSPTTATVQSVVEIS